MRKTVISIILLALTLTAGAETVKNSNKPLKGEWNFDLQKVWEVDTAGDEPLVGINAIQVDDPGNIYVLDFKQAQFHIFSPQGKYIKSFAKRGEGPGEMKMAFTCYLINNLLVVPDSGKIHYFSKEGKYIESKNPGFMIFPRDFVDRYRFLYIKETEEEKSSTDILELFDLRTNTSKDLAKISRETELSASAGGMQIKLKDISTTPSLIVTSAGDSLYFGKSDKYLIKISDLDGKVKQEFSMEGRKRKDIPMEFKRKRFEDVSINNRKPTKKMIDQMIKGIPDQAPFYNRIMISENGLIYVFVADPAYRKVRTFDIFSPKGKYLYNAKITLPDNYIMRSQLTFKKDFLYVYAENEEGDYLLVKYKIKSPKTGS